MGKLYRAVKEAQLWDPSQDHAWFAGYAPADNPKIAIVVLVEHGGHGGAVAAPPAMKIIRGALGLPARVVAEIGSGAADPDAETSAAAEVAR